MPHTSWSEAMNLTSDTKVLDLAVQVAEGTDVPSATLNAALQKANLTQANFDRLVTLVPSTPSSRTPKPSTARGLPAPQPPAPGSWSEALAITRDTSLINLAVQVSAGWDVPPANITVALQKAKVDRSTFDRLVKAVPVNTGDDLMASHTAAGLRVIRT